MSDRLIETRDLTGTLHDFYGDDSCASHMPEKCRACHYDRLKTQNAALADALEAVIAVADRNTVEFDAARAALRAAGRLP